jgi:hypothetical protein
MPNLVALKYGADTHYVNPAHVSAVTTRWTPNRTFTVVTLVGGGVVESTFDPDYTIALLEAAMHPTTETETR